MAERLAIEELPRGSGAWQAKYPWEEWLDGGVWRLTRGVDFDRPLDRFGTSVRAAADRRGGKVVVRKSGPGMVDIQFYVP